MQTGMISPVRLGAVGCLLFLAAAIGCSQNDATLSGEVMLDGQLVQATQGVRGTISFEPQSGANSAPAVAKIDERGRYTAAIGANGGLAPGDYAISVNILRVHPPAEEGGMPRPERISPRKYTSSKTSGLTVTVSPGSNKYDIIMETTGERNG